MDFWDFCDNLTPAPTPARAVSPVIRAAAAVELAMPPGSITGGKVTTEATNKQNRLLVDWLAGTFVKGRDMANLFQVVGKIEKLLGSKGEGRATRINFYEQGVFWPECGAFVVWDETRDRAQLSLPGKACGRLTCEQMRVLVKWLDGLAFRCTRVDCTFDDFTRKLIPLDQIHAAGRAYDFTPLRTYKDGREYTCGELVADVAKFGTWGENGGGVHVVFYNKDLESGGLVPSDRVESRFGTEGQRGPQVFADLVAAADDDDSFAQVIGRAIGGSISFVTRGTHRHVARMEVHAWWAALVEQFGSTRYLAIRLPTTDEKRLEYIDRQLGGLLANVSAVLDKKGGHGAGLRVFRAIIKKHELKVDRDTLQERADQLPAAAVTRAEAGAVAGTARGRPAPAMTAAEKEEGHWMSRAALAIIGANSRSR